MNHYLPLAPSATARTRGLFITFEGQDGSGKSVQAAALAAHGVEAPAGRTRRRVPNEDIFIVGFVNPQTLKARIIADNLLPWDRCVVCASSNMWLGKELTLELDHVDGNTQNNVLGNLRFLCPNCHAQTPTFRGRNRGMYTHKAGPALTLAA